MELLFKTETSAGNTELKELLGFIDADLKIKNLKPDIITATNDVIDLIGKEVYNYAVAKYKESVPSTEGDAVIYATRYPVAVKAYLLYAPSNDLAHTNNGRKMRQDEGEKQAFEWMIDRNNAELERRYYRALDDLIKFLDNSKVETELTTTLYTIWTNSDAYKATQKLFIRTTKDFDDVFPINSRLLLIKLAPALSDCERYEIIPRIGILKATLLKAANNADSPELDAADIELIRLIKLACVAYSFSWAMTRLSVQLYPEGVLQHYTSDRMTTRGAKPSLKTETQEAAQAWKGDFDRAILAIEKHVKPLPVPDIITEDDFRPNQCSDDLFFST